MPPSAYPVIAWKPSIVRYNFYYSRSCGDCLKNETACLAKHCVTGDGLRRGILTANRQLPGPSIQVEMSNTNST